MSLHFPTANIVDTNIADASINRSFMELFDNGSGIDGSLLDNHDIASKLETLFLETAHAYKYCIGV